MAAQQPREALTLATIFRYDATGGILAVTAMLAALLMVNTSLSAPYDWLHDISLPLANDAVGGSKTLAALITDLGLFILFLVYGTRLKLNFGTGTARGLARFVGPALIGLGAVLVPAILIYATLGVTGGEATGRAGILDPKVGWIVPTGTDLAVMMALLTMTGVAASERLRQFAAETATFAGITAIVLISVVNADLLSGLAVAALSFSLIAMLALRFAGMTNGWLYLAIGAALWVILQGTGVHGALAGVITAGFIPAAAANSINRSFLPAASWGFVPLIAFFNSGIDFSAMQAVEAPALPLALPIPLSLYVAFSLFVGKQIGVFMMTKFVLWLGNGKSGIGHHAFHHTFHDTFDGNGRLIYAVSVLAGSGFGLCLAFSNLAGLAPELIGSVRLGILIGSVASAILAIAVLSNQQAKLSAKSDKIVLFAAGPIAGASLAIFVTYTDLSGLSNAGNNFVELLLFTVFASTALMAVSILCKRPGPTGAMQLTGRLSQAPAATGVVGPDTDLSTINVEELRGLL